MTWLERIVWWWSAVTGEAGDRASRLAQLNTMTVVTVAVSACGVFPAGIAAYRAQQRAYLHGFEDGRASRDD